MKKKIILGTIFCLFLSIALLEARTWTQAKTGKTMDGEFRKVAGGNVEVIRSNGTAIKLPLAMLSEEDKKFVAEKLAAESEKNKAAETPKVTHKKGEKLQVGDVIDLSFRSMNAGKVNLSEMKGKVILLDFWATWCGPCIAELPNVKEAYKEYHEKGFEIIGISLDSDKGALKGFIRDNDMPWPQFFDGKGWKNELAQEYGVRSIPSVALVRDNKVIALNVRGSGLDSQLKKLLP